MPPRAKRVAIVGGGLAGTACALRLAELGPDIDVTVYEQSIVGGTSAYAIGSFTAAGTRWQKTAGIEDTAAEHLETLLALCAFDGDEADRLRYRALLEECCREGAATLETLASWGLSFAGPYLEPPHPKARMHNVISSGAAMMGLLRVRLESTAVDVREQAAVRDVAREGAGFTIASGTACETFDEVVVACGDRAARTGAIPGLNPNATGEPIDMAARLSGAKAHKPQFAPGLRATAPGAPSIEPAKDFVRVCDVLVDGSTIPGERFLDDVGAFAERDVFLRVLEPDRLAGQRISTWPGVGYATLRDVGRTPLVRRRAPLELGPFRVVVSFVDDGLDVDSQMRVIDARGAPAEHLYACGSAGVGGMRLEGHGHHLLWAAHSGLRAAAAIARGAEGQDAI
jgi:fumarate reductase flavoprotein subunit